MLKSFKTEINPTEEQKVKIRKTIGTCRFIYNFYLAYNKELYDKGKKFMSGKSFSVWLNNEYLPNHVEYSWIKLRSKCNENNIELRVVDRWYPSSKICHHCGNIKKDLKLSDRTYKCECGYIEDRDINAALNLRDARIYEAA